MFLGVSFCGSDVGGFIDHPEDELFVRWYQAGAFQPFFRSHANLESPYREPYLLPTAELGIVRASIRKRYALLPFWYTLFYEHERTGLPIMRPMLSEYPMDKSGYKLDDQYMLSNVLLVRPVVQKGDTKVNVYFPSIDGAQKAEIWYDTDDYRKITAAGLQSVDVDANKTPVYQRGGTILPRKEVVRKASIYMHDDPISLFVAVDANNEATGTLFMDDEQSYDYRRGYYHYLRFTLKDNEISSKKIDETVGYQTRSQIARFVIIGMDPAPKKATIVINGAPAKDLNIEVLDNHISILTPELSLTDQWTLTMSGAKQNILCAGVLLMALTAQIVKYLF